METNRFRQARMMNGGKSLDYVARESGVSKNTIWKLETDQVDAGYSLVCKLANYYSVSAAWLIGQAENASLSEDRQTASRITGLSGQVIDWLASMGNDSESVTALDMLLSSDSFRDALKMFAQARKISAYNNQSIEEAEEIERSNLFRIRHQFDGNAPYKVDSPNTISNRQLIQMYRNESLMALGEALKQLAPDEKEGEK